MKGEANSIMAFIFERDWKKQELLERVGDMSQIAGLRRFTLAEGKEKGVEAIEFKTGTGFNFTVLPSRGMDIFQAEYCGKSLCWHSSTGAVGPEYYEPEGLGWLRGFYGGLVVTCGLNNVGAPCCDEGKELGLHGRVSNTPAKNVCVDTYWDNDDYIMWAQGKMRETVVFDENLLLTRKVWAKLGESKIYIEDTVENQGFDRTEHMYLYHINGGFPVIDGNARLISPTLDAIPRDDDARIGAENYGSFDNPTHGYKEKCYYHDMKPDKDGTVYSALVNDNFNNGQGFGFYIKYNKNQLPMFTEWKMNGKGNYVVGMEPANCKVEGRDKDRKEGILQFLDPGEKRQYNLEIGVLSSAKDIKSIEEKIQSLL